MKKVIRLTESQLTNIIKKVINEQSTLQKTNYSALQKFLNAIDRGQNSYPSKWVLDPNNTNGRGSSVKLRGKEGIIFPTDYLNKPLLWSLIVNGQKDKSAVFQIFSSEDKLYFYCYSTPSMGYYQNTEAYEEFVPNVTKAINLFNQRVKMKL